MMLHTLNYTTLDISNQSLNLNNFKIIGKFKVVGNSSNISGHPSEGFHIPFLFENYDSFQIIHYPERYYFRIKDNANNWLPWQRHKHKIADIDGLQSTLDSFTNSISSIQSTLNSHSNSISSIQSTLNSHSNSISSIQSTLNSHSNSISSIQSTLNSHSNSISSIQSTLNSLNARVSALENTPTIRLPAGVILAVAWNFNLYSSGYRVLPLYGDSIHVSHYPNLVSNTYVGDSYNHIAHFFYRFNSWNGQRSTSGDLFKLPDTRALVPKGRFSGNAGGYFGTRYKYNSDIIGNVVEDTLENHRHSIRYFRCEEGTHSGTVEGAPYHIVTPSNADGYRCYYIYRESEWISSGRTYQHTRDSSFAVDFVITY